MRYLSHYCSERQKCLLKLDQNQDESEREREGESGSVREREDEVSDYDWQCGTEWIAQIKHMQNLDEFS